jgi:hypothetical protein
MTATAEQIVEMLLNENLENKLPHLLKQFPNVNEQTIGFLAHIDPTPTKQYITWILRQYVDGNLNPQQNIEQVQHALAEYDQFKRRNSWQGERDINRYDVDGLVNAVEQAHRQPERGQGVQYGQLMGHAGSLRLFRLSTVPEIVAASQGTAWCTKVRQFAEKYVNEPLYLVTKQARPYVLLQPKSVNVRNIHDRTVSEQEAQEIAPVMHFIPPEQWAKPVHAVDPEGMRRRQQLLKQARERFMAERMKGYMTSKGEQVRPVSQQTALRLWRKAEPNFRRTLVDDVDSHVIEKFQLGANRNVHLLQALGVL